MKVTAHRQKGFELLQQGIIEFAQIEKNGIRVDTKKLAHTKEDLGKKIRSLKEELESAKVWKLWRKRFGPKSNLSSRSQLGTILYDVMGFKIDKMTVGGEAAADEEALSNIDDPFVKQYVRFSKYEKALGTFLKGIEREVVNGRLHPSFNLHKPRSYRSSSDSPNFQNFPVRDKEVAQIIRSLFVASKGNNLVENDFKGIEVSVSACYHKDSNFISYITTPGKDMHRDMAAQIYMLKPEQVSKDTRYGAKNKFVFPQFYGDYYVACAKNLWEWIDKGKLNVDGLHLRDHLAYNGIKELGDCNPDESPRAGTFEKHIQEVENDFWNNRFMEYGKWRRQFYKSYLNNGYFDILSGFRVHGFLNRNSVTNYPVQGAAFHCLLWSLIQMNKALRKYKMESMIVGQIHDSLIGDVKPNELGNYLEMIEEITTVKLRKHFDWLIVPLEIEYEIAPDNGSWFDKREVKFKQGVFSHPDHPEKKTRDAQKFLNALRKKNETE